MKKSILWTSLSLCLLSTSSFANACLDKINTHVWNNGTMLVLESCKINDSDMQTVIDFLQKNPDIYEVYLDNNDISDLGVDQLKLAPNLSWLSISNNKLGASGARTLAELPLEMLSIDDNNIGDDGAKAIARNTTIKQLFVEHNNITSEGVIALASHPTVYNLGIGQNNFNKQA